MTEIQNIPVAYASIPSQIVGQATIIDDTIIIEMNASLFMRYLRELGSNGLLQNLLVGFKFKAGNPSPKTEGTQLMASAEDRQAKALEGIHHSAKELVKVLATLNENFVQFAKAVKSVETDPNQLTIDELRAQAEAERAEETARQDRDRRARYEETLRSSPIDAEKNRVEHMSEFNNPEHRPAKFQYGEGS